MNLEHRADELIELLPLPGVQVATQENGPYQIRALYYTSQPDPLMDWNRYYEWIRSLGPGVIALPEFPVRAWSIYHRAHCFFETGKVTRDSTAVLYFFMSANSVRAHLEFIERNRSDKFKGIGTLFFNNLVARLRSRGYEGITARPLNERLEDFWRSLGFEKDEAGFVYHMDLQNVAG